MGIVKTQLLNKKAGFFIILTAVITSIPWLGEFRIWGLMYILLNLVTAINTYCCFFLLFEEQMIALLCMGMYTLSIYRIGTLTIGNAPMEGVVLAFLPWVICSWYKICIAGRRKSTICMAGSVTLFIGSLWYFSPYIDARIQGKSVWQQVSYIQERGIYFAHLWFQFWKGGNSIPQATGDMSDTVSVGIGFVLMLAVCFFGVLWFGNHLEKEHCLSSLSKFVFGGSIIMMWMSLNIFPWERLQRLSGRLYWMIGEILMPQRFLGWATLFSVEIFGYCLWLFQQKQKRIFEVIFGVGVISILTGGIYLMDFVMG